MPTDVLDMGAMAVLMGTVALGLEKVSMEQNPLTKQLNTLQSNISRAITELDLEISYIDDDTKERKITPFCNNGEFHFLLVVAQHPARKHYPISKRRQWALHRAFVSAPLLTVMRRGWHVPVVFGLTILSVVCLLFQKAGQVYGFDGWGPLTGIDDHYLYVLYCLTIAATLLFALIAHWLSGVEPRCDGILKELRREKKHEEKNARAMMERELTRFTGPTGLTGPASGPKP